MLINWYWKYDILSFSKINEKIKEWIAVGKFHILFFSHIDAIDWLMFDISWTVFQQYLLLKQVYTINPDVD